MTDLLQRHGEKVRYLVVGAWNTLFGYLAYAALYALLGHRLNYMLVLVPAYVVSITNAYLCYKFLVFRTKGNYMREYFRFYLVYGTAFALNLVLLPFFVQVVGLSPIPAQIPVVALTVVLSYIGHKYFTFRSVLDEFEGDAR